MDLQIRVEISQGEEDWVQVRECFVRAFHRYPLYKYLIPNEKKRPEFLRRYLEAIYEVAVRNGNSILLCIKLVGNEENRQNKQNGYVIGGVLFVPPSQIGGGWDCQRDEDFWDAYEKYKLKELDEEAFERMERYEEWEYENISKHVCMSGIPMWNGAFCAIEPKYAGMGCGSVSYEECLKILSKIQSEKFAKSAKKRGIKKIIEEITMKIIKLDKIMPVKKANTPTLFALSHSRQAVRFHKKNGLDVITEIPFVNTCSETNPTPPFTVSALLLGSTTDKQVKIVEQKLSSSQQTHIKLKVLGSTQ